MSELIADPMEELVMVFVIRIARLAPILGANYSVLMT